MKKIVYVDMDNVLVDFKTGIEKLTPTELIEYEGKYDEPPHIFSKMEPMENAIESYIKLCSEYDTYILSTSPWENPTALNDKLDWNN
jgi:5'(3')-deoxyribonucleotidase